jgi:transposase
VPTSGHRSARPFTALSVSREWPPSEKRRILAEMAIPGANVSAIARRHGVAQSLLHHWRKDAAAATEHPPPPFVPVTIALLPAPIGLPSPPVRAGPSAMIEIALICGRTVRVDADVDAGKLAAIIAALEAKA